MTLKVHFLQTLRRLFIILLGLTMTWFSEKMLISNKCRRDLMLNLMKKSWTVSNADYHTIPWFSFFPIITYLSTARTFIKEQTSHLWPSRPERKVLLNEKKWQHLSPHSLFSFLIRNVFFSIVFCWQGYYRSALKKTERLRNNTVYVITRFEHSSTQ